MLIVYLPYQSNVITIKRLQACDLRGFKSFLTMTTESKHQQAAKSIRSGELKELFHLSDVADMVNSSLKAIVGSFSSDKPHLITSVP